MAMRRWLLLRVLAYQIQVAALGGPDKATLRVNAKTRRQDHSQPLAKSP